MSKFSSMASKSLRSIAFKRVFYTSIVTLAAHFSAEALESEECCIPEICCESESRFFFRADLLYWKPHISGLELDFGNDSLTQVTTDGLVSITSDENDRDPHFKWNADYRLAAGYKFACSDLEVGACWTHFQGSGHRSSREDIDTVNYGKISLKFDQIDLALAYNMQTCSSLTLKPFVGLRGVRIKEHLDSNLVTDITFVPGGLATETRTLDDTQNYRGIGPLFGVNGDWDIGCGFGIYGTAAASVLYGVYKIHLDDSDIFTAPISREVFSTGHRRQHGFDCNIDLALGVRWETCLCDCYPLVVKLGFEHHQYFDLNHLGANRGDISLDGGVLSIETSL